jgi:insulysin
MTPVSPDLSKIPIIKSEFDNREYKAFTLPNGLKALVIHEEGLDKSCASLNVHVGSFQDPIDAQGLAHFLEHLLFMGTVTYPKEN